MIQAFIKMNICRTILFLCLIVSIAACSTKKTVKTRPAIQQQSSDHEEIGEAYGMLEESPDDINLAMRKSQLNLKYKLNKNSIAETFNSVLDSLMSNNTFELDEYNLNITLLKQKDATVEFQDKSVLINFPLKITAEKKTFLQDLLVEGEINLSVITDIEIDKYWNLFTNTELIDYSWVTKPQAKMGSISIPIEKIMNLVIDRTKSKVVKEIDRTIKEEFALKSQIISVMDMIGQPISLDRGSDIELQINVDSFAMTGTYNTFDWTEGIISVTGVGEVIGAKDYSSAPDDLPVFSWLDSQFKKDSSDIYFNIDLELNRINKLVSDRIVGKRFSENGKEIVVEKVELKGLDDKLGVVADVSGSYDGQIFLSARPEFDADKKTLKSEDIEISILTKNVLHKALAWMLKGKIKKELDKTLQFSLKDFLDPIQKQIDEQVKEINKQGGLQLSVDLQDLDIEEFKFSKTKIHAAVHVPLILELSILNFNTLVAGANTKP